VKAFLARNKGFSLRPIRTCWQNTIGGVCPASADGEEHTLLLTPHHHGVDGFFVAVLEKL
jgi:16S rRNA (cytosine967-C5)-methyltransferase